MGQYRHAKSKREATYSHAVRGPLLVCMSAHEKETLKRVVADIAAIAPDYYALDLAHTLNLHRTMFQHRAFAILREGEEASSFDSSAIRTGVKSAEQTIGTAFIFTGQGVCIPAIFHGAARCRMMLTYCRLNGREWEELPCASFPFSWIP